MSRRAIEVGDLVAGANAFYLRGIIVKINGRHRGGVVHWFNVHSSASRFVSYSYHELMVRRKRYLQLVS